MSFETFNKIKSILSPAQPIVSTPKKDNNIIESSAEQTIQSEQLEASVDSNNAKVDQSIASSISSISKDVMQIDNEYNTNLYYNILNQANTSHKLTNEFIKGSNDPLAISSASSDNSSQLLGLKKASENLPKPQKDSINNILDLYSQSSLQSATVKNSNIHATNMLNTVSNGLTPQINGWETQLENEKDPKKVKEILDHITDTTQKLEDIRPHLTTDTQKIHLDGIVNQMASTALRYHQEQPVIPSLSTSDAILGSSSQNIQHAEAYSKGIEDTFYGGDARHVSADGVKSNYDFNSAYNANIQTKILTNSLGNSMNLSQDIDLMRNSNDPVAKQVGNLAFNLKKKGKADELAYLMSPTVKASKDKLNSSSNAEEYQNNTTEYQRNLKSWMNHRQLPDSAYNPLTEQQNNLLGGFANMESTPENLGEMINNANVIHKMSGDTHKTIFGGSWGTNALRNVRFLENDKNGNLTNPQEASNIIKSYSPNVQKQMSNDNILFQEESDKSKTKYKTASGNDSAITNSGDLLKYVASNAVSGFNIDKLTTLTGNNRESLIRSAQTQIYLKMKDGETMDSAINDVKNNNMNMLMGHPVYNGKSSDGSTFSINQDVASSYGLANVSQGDYKAVISNLNNIVYNKLIHKHNIVVPTDGANNQLNKNYTLDQITDRNKSILGDKEDSHIYSSNGRLWARYNGYNYPLNAHDVGVAVNSTDVLKERIKDATDDYASKKMLPEYARAWM